MKRKEAGWCSTVVFNRGARLPRGSQQIIRGIEPLRALQHGKCLIAKVFRPIYLFKVRAIT